MESSYRYKNAKKSKYNEIHGTLAMEGTDYDFLQ